MDSDSPIDELLQQLTRVDEVDGPPSIKSLIRRVGSLISIASRAISYLLKCIKPCVEKDFEARASVLEEISRNLVSLSDLIITLSIEKSGENEHQTRRVD